MNEELAVIICSKKSYRTLEEYALTLTGIPPLPAYPQQALEDKECKRLYQSNLTTLQRAVSVGVLQASPNIFSDNPKEYVCSFEDFLAWTKADRPDLYAQYAALKANDAAVSDENKTEQPPGIYGKRDKDAIAWVEETHPDLGRMTNTEIRNALKARDAKREIKLWAKGFADWNRSQKVWPKKSPGKKPQVKP